MAGAFRVLALDFPGHGKSEWPRPPRYRMHDFVRAVVGFADGLGIGHLDLVGHSMGGKVAMLTGAWHPRRARSLVVVDGTPDVSADGLAEIRQIGARPLRRFLSRQAAARAFRLIPHATLCEIPDTCHHLTLERPDDVARVIRDFVMGHALGERRPPANQ